MKKIEKFAGLNLTLKRMTSVKGGAVSHNTTRSNIRGAKDSSTASHEATHIVQQ